MLDFFLSGKFSLISTFPESEITSKIIITEVSSDYAMNKHSSKRQLAVVALPEHKQG